MILVVGAGRCGTSAVCRVLTERAGVDFGGPGRVKEATPDGDFEDPIIRGLDWARLNRDITDEEWIEQARRYTTDKAEPWGLKHPPMAEFLETVQVAFPDALVVWCQREPEAIWESWQKWFTTPPEEAWGRINRRQWTIWLCALRWPHVVTVDMTERRTDDELADALGESIEKIKPGYLEWASLTAS